MRILITGGTGVIGQRLCPALLAAGHELTVLSRSPAKVQRLCGAAVKPMASLQEWLPAVHFDVVINLAGEPIIDARWTEKRKQLLLDSRVALTRELVACMQFAAQKPALFLSGSAIGYYGDTGDRIIDETAELAQDFGAQLCSAWEHEANQSSAMGIRTILLRTGLVFDARGGMLQKMLLPFKLGLATRLGQGQQWMSWIHIADYVDAVLFLLAHPDAEGAFNMVAPNAVRNAEFTQTLASVLHRPAIFAAPAWLLNAAMGEMSLLLLGGQHVVPKKLQALGFAFNYPSLDHALQALVTEG